MVYHKAAEARNLDLAAGAQTIANDREDFFDDYPGFLFGKAYPLVDQVHEIGFGHAPRRTCPTQTAVMSTPTLLPQLRPQSRPHSFDQGRMNAINLLICKRAILCPVCKCQGDTLLPRSNRSAFINIEDRHILEHLTAELAQRLHYRRGRKLAVNHQCQVT